MMKSTRRIAEFLLQSKAIKLEPANHFTWASGWKSPIYCDNRITLSFPEIRKAIRDAYVECIRENFEIPDVIAGVATGAIAQGALVAEALHLPFIYVRSAPKDHGMQNLIEGRIEKGQKIIVIEDLISTGGSSMKAIEAIRKAGCIVTGMIATFTYGFQVADKNFTANNLTVLTLTSYDDLLAEALSAGYISREQMPMLEKWREDPANWGK